MIKTKDLFNSFKEDIDPSNYPLMNSFIKNKVITKGLALIIAFSTLAGCQSTPQIYEINLFPTRTHDVYQDNLESLKSTNAFSDLKELDLVDIANGKSGIFMKNEEILIISNIDDGDSMTAEEKKQLDLLVSKRVISITSGGSSHIAPVAFNNSVSYINVNKGEVLEMI